MKRIAGTVVLYNPSEKNVENIYSYSDHIEILYAIDNSEYPNQIIVEKVKNIPNVVYQWNGGNIGVAGALNIGATLALEQRYDFLLMMDQDSVASSNLIQIFSEYLSSHSPDEIGILYPCHSYKNYQRPRESTTSRDILVADTSGSLLNLEVYEKVGRFLDKLFIDYVDFEYCLRLRSHGFRVIQLNEALLYQQLGNLISKRFLFWRVGVTNHTPVRIFYRVRNRLCVATMYLKKYPRWSIKQILFIGIEIMKILLYENHKLDKCKYALIGVWHWIIRKYGKYSKQA